MFSGTITVSNRATWTEIVELRETDTDDLIDLTQIDEIIMEVRDPDTQSPVLSGSLSGGELTLLDDEGLFQWRFEASAMRSIDPKTYELGITIEDNDDTAQLMIGYLQVLDGIIM